MRYLLVHGEYQTISARHPAAINLRDAWGRIKTALQSVPMSHGWLDSNPRIVRTGGLGNGTTHVSGVWVLDDQSDAAANSFITSPLKPRIDDVMSTLGEQTGETAVWLGGFPINADWSGVEVLPFNEATNGPLSFWSGPHAQTRTREQFPGLSTDPEENPMGPTSGDTHPGGTSESVDKALTTITWIVGLGAAAVIAWSASSTVRSVFGTKRTERVVLATDGGTKKNPGHHRSHAHRYRLSRWL